MRDLPAHNMQTECAQKLWPSVRLKRSILVILCQLYPRSESIRTVLVPCFYCDRCHVEPVPSYIFLQPVADGPFYWAGIVSGLLCVLVLIVPPYAHLPSTTPLTYNCFNV